MVFKNLQRAIQTTEIWNYAEFGTFCTNCRAP